MTSERFGSRLFMLTLTFLMLTTLSVGSNNDQKKEEKQAGSQQTQGDPLQRPLSEKQRKKNAKAMMRELAQPYKQFLQDVIPIISKEELDVFAKLSNDEERDQFIEQFWIRRDPTPDTPENEFREEHYRRLQYANDHFAAGVPGWRTDRGMIYIKFGAPDEVEPHPSGGTYERPFEQGGGAMSTYPFEVWRYRHIDDIGDDINIEFVDDCQCGTYRMMLNPEDKNALAHVPGGQPPTNPGLQSQQSSKEFDRLETFFNLQRQAQLKFNGLREEKIGRAHV